MHGVRVADPYRWLEALDSEQTRAWVEAENALTARYFESLPQRVRIRARLAELWDYERYGLPERHGESLFFTKNDGLLDQSVLYAMDFAGGEPRMLLDPNTLSDDGTVSLAGTAYSEDGRHLAYALADGGSDWRTVHVREVETGRELPDVLRWVKFSPLAWRHDGSGFFYSRYPEPPPGEERSSVNYDQQLWFHRLGTDQAQDELVYGRPDKREWGFGGTVSDDGRYLVIRVRLGTSPKNAVFYQDLEQPGAPVVELLPDWDAGYSFVGNDGPVFFFTTDLDAPRGRVIAVDTRHPERESWQQIVAEDERTLESASLVGNRLVLSYLRDAHSVVEVRDLQGAFLRTVELPGLGSVSGFGGKRQDPLTYYSFSGFNAPDSIYSYRVDTGATEVFRVPKLAFEPDDYVTEQVFYRSLDGTRVPMFLSYKRGLARDGQNPVLLYGYGGFNVSQTPSFNVARLAWMELGGIYAVANIRGGGEYGEGWHQSGIKLQKQNVFDDFIAAAEWLVSQRWTSAEKLAIHGGSNGGLLVGACITQRPELFGAAIPAVGVLDMLRFHRFTIGWAWISDYGSVEDEDEFHALAAYSPYHNIERDRCYPPTLITTADRDDRVVPAHSFKFAAALQHAQGCANPILIRIETRAGHGAGTPTSKRIEQHADELAFLMHELGME
jgi:prolyl oligopeptidase